MILGVFLFFLGLVIGSFINSFLWRYQTKTTYAGRSMCPACKHQLAWYDNLPLVSWFLLSGKCRYCKKSISVQYPIVELLTGVSFALIGLFSPSAKSLSKALSESLQLSTRVLTFNLALLLLTLGTASVLIIISIYDYKTKEIPNKFNAIFIGLSLVTLLVTSVHSQHLMTALYYILSGILAFLFFYAFVFFSKETWMGGGDAKMAFGMGVLLGPAGTFLAILIASVSGSIYGIAALIIGKGRSEKTSKISPVAQNNLHQVPFGPFLALGTYITMVFGPQIINWYVRIVLGL